jgi:esterase FrsA
LTAESFTQVSGRPKNLEEAKQWMRERLSARLHPMNSLEVNAGAELINNLKGLDADAWTDTWGGAGDRAFAEAKVQVQCGNLKAAAQLFARSSGYYFMGRFPCPNHPKKLRCAELERETYLAAGELWDPPVLRISIPFEGRDTEGAEIVFLYRRPPAVERPPVVIMWGGVDAWKEQMTLASNAFLAQGVATIAMDNAGTGESPVRGIRDAERQFLPVFKWAAAQPNLNAAKAGCLGRSFGGYWATKLAHLHPDMISGAVNWGGGAHYMFQKEWIESSRYPDSYLMELVETRCRMLGADNYEEYVESFSKLSLLDQNLLDRACAPLLLVNGKLDRQCPIEDLYLLLEHGSPKTVRLFPGGHMGITPTTLSTIVSWLSERVHAASAHA